jgi:hypothetical protein
MDKPHHTMIKGIFAVGSGYGSWLVNHFQWLGPFCSHVALVFGALAAVLTCVSLGFDLVHKIRKRMRKEFYD